MKKDSYAPFAPHPRPQSWSSFLLVAVDCFMLRSPSFSIFVRPRRRNYRTRASETAKAVCMSVRTSVPKIDKYVLIFSSQSYWTQSLSANQMGFAGSLFWAQPLSHTTYLLDGPVIYTLTELRSSSLARRRRSASQPFCKSITTTFSFEKNKPLHWLLYRQ
jgi:hypothetical protein